MDEMRMMMMLMQLELIHLIVMMSGGVERLQRSNDLGRTGWRRDGHPAALPLMAVVMSKRRVMDGEPAGRQVMSRPALMLMMQTVGVVGQRDGQRSVVGVSRRMMRMVAESGVTPVAVAAAVRRRRRTADRRTAARLVAVNQMVVI
jgi:hypothetical protein